MNRITGRSAFLALLKDEGITHLFGNPGTTELPIMHALKDHPDLTYVMATQESLAPDAYKAMVVAAETKDILYTPAISGLPANFMRQSIEAAGLDPAALPPPKGLHQGDLPNGLHAWRDIWSAGQGAGLVHDIPTTAALVDRLEADFQAAQHALPHPRRSVTSPFPVATD